MQGGRGGGEERGGRGGTAEGMGTVKLESRVRARQRAGMIPAAHTQSMPPPNLPPPTPTFPHPVSFAALPTPPRTLLWLRCRPSGWHRVSMDASTADRLWRGSPIPIYTRLVMGVRCRAGGSPAAQCSSNSSRRAATTCSTICPGVRLPCSPIRPAREAEGGGRAEGGEQAPWESTGNEREGREGERPARSRWRSERQPAARRLGVWVPGGGQAASQGARGRGSFS